MEPEQKRLFDAAKLTMANSYCPYSNYQVGASILTTKGNIYSGTNIENVSYSLTLCAESAAISQMIAAGETEIKALLVMANHDRMCSPCGACRQRVAEFAENNTVVSLCNHQTILQTTDMQALLPYAFEEKNLTR